MWIKAEPCVLRVVGNNSGTYCVTKQAMQSIPIRTNDAMKIFPISTEKEN